MPSGQEQEGCGERLAWNPTQGPRPGSVSLIEMHNNNAVAYALGHMVPPTEGMVESMRQADRRKGHPDIPLAFTPLRDSPGEDARLRRATRRTVRFSFRMPGGIHAAAERLAERRGLSLNTFLLMALQGVIIREECGKRRQDHG